MTHDNDKVHFPDSVQNYKYAGDKISELSTLLECLRNPQSTKLVFQNLPRHMRRRTMTHNAKRLPRKFRQAHISQMRKSGLPQRTKRSSRKYRRKPSNIMMEFIRRQRDQIWLETHIWHAKRFHMTERWGYKLPLAPCDKSFRACYRATSKHCLIQDISYYGCIEIVGPHTVIETKFLQITSRRTGMGIGACIYEQGTREGYIDIFRKDMYPYGAIGKISFMWHPSKALLNNRNVKTIWLFSHPGFYKELLTELIDLFEVKRIPYSSDVEPKKKQPQRIAKMYSLDRTPRYINSGANIEIIELKDTLNRFRLTGPLAHAVVHKAFKCKESMRLKDESEISMNAHIIQSEFWSSVKYVTSTAELSPNMIVALNIEDPRLNRPKKRTKAIAEGIILGRAMIQNNCAEIPKGLSISRIWKTDIRNRLMDTMISTAELCKLRNDSVLVPGESGNFENDVQSVPLLLVQRPGSQNNNIKRLGYGSGWDIIIPAGYGISTWISLIMWGARAGGLRETKSLLREYDFDELPPDTTSGLNEDDRNHFQLRAAYFRKPPNKRLNYNKLSITSPFKCNWQLLVEEWITPSDEKTKYFVLRDNEIFKGIQMSLNRKIDPKKLEIPSNCLIPVTVRMTTRGYPKKNSIICLPHVSDFSKASTNHKLSNKAPIYVETLRNDFNEKLRKKLRHQHLKLLKKLRNRRIRAKRKLQETSNHRVNISKPLTEKIIAEQFRKMSNLWLKEHPETIRKQCSREVLGFLTQGDFYFTEAHGCGIGYVTGAGFIQLITLCWEHNNKNVMVLIRSPATRNYRMATLKISNINNL